MKKIIGAFNGLGTIAIMFIIIWTMVLGSWIVYAVIAQKADISPAMAGVFTAFLALPYTFAKMLNDRYPRKEPKDVTRDSNQ